MPKRALGTKILIGVNAIAGLTSIGGLNLTADTVDTTTLASAGGYREFTGGFKDGGEVSLSGYFEPGDTNGQNAVYNAFESGSVTAFSIVFPAEMGANWGFNGVVTGITTGAELEGLVTWEATIKVSGKPVLGTTASGGLTALSLVGTAGALTPTFSNGTYTYAFSGVTATSVTVTATAAAHTLQLYIDGVYSQDLTTAIASNSIPITAIGSKKLSIVAFESGKTQKIYEIAVIKTA